MRILYSALPPFPLSLLKDLFELFSAMEIEKFAGHPGDCRRIFKVCCAYSVGDTPDSIPNSEVKPHSGDGTARATVWESSSAQLFLCRGVAQSGQRTCLGRRGSAVQIGSPRPFLAEQHVVKLNNLNNYKLLGLLNSQRSDFLNNSIHKYS